MRANDVTKFALFILFTTVCVAGALIPEIAMYLAWIIVSPSSEFAKIAMVGVLAMFGGGLSIAFGVLGVSIWAAGTQEILK